MKQNRADLKQNQADLKQKRADFASNRAQKPKLCGFPCLKPFPENRLFRRRYQSQSARSAQTYIFLDRFESFLSSATARENKKSMFFLKKNIIFWNFFEFSPLKNGSTTSLFL